MKATSVIMVGALALTACAKRVEPTWQDPRKPGIYVACWSNLANKPCIIEQDGGKYFLHTRTDLELPVFLLFKDEDGKYHVTPVTTAVPSP